jgi:hypothetical protein
MPEFERGAGLVEWVPFYFQMMFSDMQLAAAVSVEKRPQLRLGIRTKS